MGAPHYLIRPARAGDIPAVAAMWRLMADQHRAYDAEHWCWSPQAPVQWEGWYRQMLWRPGMVLPVAQQQGGPIVGFAIAFFKDDPNLFTALQTGQVLDLFVHPDHRRRGVGGALLQWTLDSLKVLGAQDVRLHVAMANPGAVRLYEKLGLRPVMVRMYRRL